MGPLFTVLIKENEVIQVKTTQANRPQFTGWPISQELFASPPRDFRPATYWFWSREVDPSAFRAQLEEMKAAGIYSLWIQPRLGFPMEKFMSPEYFELYRQALEVAIELGLSIGIYDDYNWITGHCGGRTVAENNAYRESHTFWVEVPLHAGSPLFEPEISGVSNLLTEGHKEALTWLYEDAVVAWGNWQILSAFTYQRTREISTSSVQGVKDHLEFVKTGPLGCSLRPKILLDQEATHLLIFVTAQCETSRLIDYLNPEATEAFIRVGYDPYYQELQDYWDHIWAMFCDEPYSGLYVWDQMIGTLSTSLMFNPDLYAEFQESKGYDIRDYLYALVWPTDGGANYSTWKTDFFQVYAERVQRVFFKPLRDWSHTHGVLFVGHELMTQLNGHWAFTTASGFDVVANFGADHFGIGELKDISTADSGSFDRNIAAKLASSIAHVYGKNGSMLEQYTPSFEAPTTLPAARGDWDLTAQTVKQQMDFYGVQGLSQFLWHGYFHSNDVVGANTALYSQRFDFPPGINYEPWFRYFRGLSDANARLGYFLSLGRHVAPVAVLYPLRTYWSEGRRGLFSQEGAFINEYLNRLHYDYDFIDERQLLEATVEQGSLIIGDESYQVVILPAVTTLCNDQVAKVLESFAKSGGAIVFSGRIPQMTQAGQQVQERLSQLVSSYHRVLYFADPLSTSPQGLDVLKNSLEGLDVRSLSIRESAQEDLGSYYCLREDAEYFYLAVVNEEERNKELEIEMFGASGRVEYWNPETGETMEWPHRYQSENGLTISYTMEAIETACFRISKTTESGLYLQDLSARLRRCVSTENGLTVEVEVGDGEPLIFTMAGISPQDHPSLQILEKGVPLDYTLEWQNQGARVVVAPRKLAPPHICSTSWTLQLVDESCTVSDKFGWEMQGHPNYSGGATYVQTIKVPAELARERLRLVPTHVYHTLEVKVNGRDCGARAWAPYHIDLPEVVVAGDNLLELLVTNTAGNKMYHQTQYDVRDKAPSGLVGPVSLVPFRVLEIVI